MSNPTPSPSGTPVASSPSSPPPPSTTTAPSQTPPSTPPSVSPPPPPLSSPPAPPPSAPPPLSSPPPPALSSPPPPPVSASAPAPSSPSATSSPPPTPSSVASPPPPQSSTPSPPPTASSPPSSVASPPPPKSSTPSPPSTATSPPPPTSSGVASPPPPKNSTPSSSTSPPPPLILASPPPPPVKSTTTTPSTSTSSPPSPASSISGSSVIAIGVAGVLAISVIAVLLYCLCKKKKKKYYPGAYYGPPGGPPSHYKDTYDGPNMRQQEWCSPSSNGSDVLIKIPPPPVPPSLPSSRNGYDPIPPAPNSGGSPGLGNSKSWFTYGELATATGGFSKSNMLGEGGFGCVYKGVLTDGQLVAVKQLKVGASQGEKEFQAEVEIISRVHHRHLVSLVGYCIAESQRLLVYDYVPNGTLEYHLYKKKEGPFMDWATRIKIACGAARGLAYLHEDCHPRIIHRDIKSSNILLDSNFEAQVSDFGLAKLTSDTNTHVTTRVMGTFGYLAPEYASSGKLTDKSDVFSFGVVLLELLTGRKPVDPSQPLGEESLVEWARPVLAQVNSEEDLDILADPSLNGVYDPKEMMRMVEAAAACVRHSANKRPRMGQVVRALEDDTSLSDLNKGLKPGHSSMYGSSFTSTDYDNANYSADMRRFRRVALESQEYSSGATSEYGVNPSVSSSEYQTSREIDRNLSSQLTKPMSVRKNTLSSNSNEFSTRN